MLEAEVKERATLDEVLESTWFVHPNPNPTMTLTLTRTLTRTLTTELY